MLAARAGCNVHPPRFRSESSERDSCETLPTDFLVQKDSHGFICAFGFNLSKTTELALRACVRRAPSRAPQVGE